MREKNKYYNYSNKKDIVDNVITKFGSVVISKFSQVTILTTHYCHLENHYFVFKFPASYDPSICLHTFIQVHSLIDEIQLSLAECLFCWSCQTALSKENTKQLLAHMQQIDNTESTDATLTRVNLTLTMALLYTMDVRSLEHDDSQGNTYKCS